mmetsp:Transcript_16926/g.43130  ORF Transcript_16926/g.43130 Transcript_16926/m.43130 type:complete len:239 (+) Transcript_16926:174-890(+)
MQQSAKGVVEVVTVLVVVVLRRTPDVAMDTQEVCSAGKTPSSKTGHLKSRGLRGAACLSINGHSCGGRARTSDACRSILPNLFCLLHGLHHGGGVPQGTRTLRRTQRRFRQRRWRDHVELATFLCLPDAQPVRLNLLTGLVHEQHIAGCSVQVGCLAQVLALLHRREHLYHGAESQPLNCLADRHGQVALHRADQHELEAMFLQRILVPSRPLHMPLIEEVAIVHERIHRVGGLGSPC